MRIDHLLITGGCGFIGRNFLRLFAKEYSKITVIDKLTYAAEPEELAQYPNVELHRVDLANFAKTIDVFKQIDPVGAVLHLAAETHNDNALIVPDAFIESNVLGTYNILKSCVSFQIGNVIHVSTDETIRHEPPATHDWKEHDSGYVTCVTVDPHFEYSRVREKDAVLAPRGPYPSSKAAAETLVMGWRTAFKLPVTIVRPCNQYGPGQHPEKLIPKVIQKLKEGVGVPLFKTPAYRDWMYVEDCCRALKLLLETPVKEREDVYHISAYNERETRKVIENIVHMCFHHDNWDYVMDSWLEEVEDRPGYDLYYSMNSSRLRDLGWKPEVSWEEGLKRTVESYLS